MGKSNNEHGYIHFSQFFQSPVGTSKEEAGVIFRPGQFWGNVSVVLGVGCVAAGIWGLVTGQGAKVHDLASAANPIVWFSNLGATGNAAAQTFNKTVITPTNQAIQSGQFTPIPMSPSDPSQITAPPTNAPR